MTMSIGKAAGAGIRPREGEWWSFQQRLLDRWIQRGLTEDHDGLVLKTDLFDEASGPHHHFSDSGLKARLIGMDWDYRIARAARDRLLKEGKSARLVVCDVQALPFPSGSLAAILSLSTLDHFEDTKSVFTSLAEITRTLARHGALLLTLDNPWNPEVMLRARLPSRFVSRVRADSFALGRTLNPWQAGRMFHSLLLVVRRRECLIHAPRFLGIRALDWLERRRMRGLARAVVHLLGAFEALSRTPLRYLTGHYIGWWLANSSAPAAEPESGSSPEGVWVD
jgi:SAM-dependent methyltransferase